MALHAVHYARQCTNEYCIADILVQGNEEAALAAGSPASALPAPWKVNMHRPSPC